MEQQAAFGVCGAQAVVLMVYMMCKTEPSAVTYTTRLRLVNGTSDVALFTQEYGVSPLVLVSSILILFFAAITHQLNEQRLLDNMVQYDEDSNSQAGMWNVVTWIMFLSVHASAILMIASPIDTYLLVLALAAILLSVCCLCTPGMRGRSTLSFVLFLVATGTVFNNIQSQRGPRIAAFAILIANDALLVVGHTYDPHPNMLTVGNCRLIHAALSSFVLLTVYGIAPGI